MSNLTKPEFTTLDISRKNYLLWILDEIYLDAMNFKDIIIDRNQDIFFLVANLTLISWPSLAKIGPYEVILGFWVLKPSNKFIQRLIGTNKIISCNYLFFQVKRRF